MPRRRSRADVANGVKFLRKSNGQFNGSQGSGKKTSAKRTSAVKNLSASQVGLLKRETARAEIVKKLKPQQREALTKVLAKKQSATSNIEKLTADIKALKGKKDADIADKFNLSVLERQLELAQASQPKRVKRDTTVKATNTRKVDKNKLNPQVQDDDLAIPQTGQVYAKKVKTKVNISEAGVNTEVSFDKSFSVEIDRGFSYKVEQDGKELVLNDNALTMRFQGEVVKGVPNIVADVKKTDSDRLIEKMAVAEAMTKKGNAPTWNTDEHGRIVDDDSLVGKTKAGDINYYGMQIHHINQWALDPAANIEADFKAGKISLDERMERYKNTIEPSTSDKAANWQLKLAPKGQREFVVLPGGLHQGGTPLYKANHPYFYDPDAKKWDKIGIPEDGDSGRKWFDSKFRSQFWKEYAKHQMTYIGQELSDRIKRGELSAKDANAKYQAAVAKYKAGELQW